MMHNLFSNLGHFQSKIDTQKFIKLIPNQDIEVKIKRLKFLKEEAKEVRIAVFGKYNHGKSTLLNALVGQEIFKAADKRETIKNTEYKYNNIIWIDTPGLDADIQSKDDEKAMEGAFKLADVILLVHSMKAGELDKNEMLLYQRLISKDTHYAEKLFLILTQADQLVDSEYRQVLNKINLQLNNVDIFPVSAVRYLKGITAKQEQFIKMSAMQPLLEKIEKIKGKIYEIRKNEITELSTYLLGAVLKEEANTRAELEKIKTESDDKDNQLYSQLSLYKDNIDLLKFNQNCSNYLSVFDDVLKDIIHHFFNMEDIKKYLREYDYDSLTVKEKQKNMKKLTQLALSNIKSPSLEEDVTLREYFEKYEIPSNYVEHFRNMINENNVLGFLDLEY